jgi:hypothetical protein
VGDSGERDRCHRCDARRRQQSAGRPRRIASAGGATEEGEGEEGTEASKRTGTGTSSSEESNGFSSLPIIFGMGGAAVLIAAIAFFVLRDAHRNAPVPEGALDGSATRISPAQVRKRRSKAKAVKQQRKRNRPR